MAWPAVQLPADVLSQIFHLRRNQEFRVWEIDPEDPEGDWNYREHGFRARWIRTTWVCRSWRDAALHTRQLWTEFSTPLDVMHPEAIGTFLGRAPEGMPLRIYVQPERRRKKKFANQNSANALEHLRPWAHRIEFLWLFIKDGSKLEKANDFLGTLGPALQTLAFGLYDKFPSLPLNIHGLRNLRKLYLKDWVPSGDTPLPDITCLITNEGFTVRPLALQRFLAACTGLEHLYIRNGLRPTSRTLRPVGTAHRRSATAEETHHTRGSSRRRRGCANGVSLAFHGYLRGGDADSQPVRLPASPPNARLAATRSPPQSRQPRRIFEHRYPHSEGR